jgi:pimeloyl-ACP methyl ester carboxylesterase
MIPTMIQEHHATVGGREMRYLESGKGRPLVLIHAFPLSADMWRRQLDRVPDGWRFVAPDLRGFGPSAVDDQPLTMDDYANDVLGLMDAAAIETAVIGGLSMGGYVTFALFRLAPGRFAGVVLADTKAQADTEAGVAARRALLETLRAGGVSAVADSMMTMVVGETTRRENPQVMTWVRELMEANKPEAIAAAVHALMGRPDSTPDLGRIRCPALVIVGEEDTVTPSADAELLARTIPATELVALPRAGHLSNLEVPEDFSGALTRFLSRAF